MSKIICDVCGTSYPETATQCPICGCVRPADVVTVNSEGDSHETQNNGSYTYVKGGRFSKANVKKRTSTGSVSRTAEKRQSGKTRQEKQKEKGDKGLIIAICVLLLAIVSVVIYIAVHFFGPERPQEGAQSPQTSVNTTVNTVVGNGNETEDDNFTDETELLLPCEDILLPKAEFVFDKVGDYDLISYTTEPDLTCDPIGFVSSDEKVVTVSEIGKLVAVGPGEAVITVRCGEVEKECRVVCNFGGQSTEPPVDNTEPPVENTDPPVENTEPSGDTNTDTTDVVLKLNYNFTLPEDPEIGDMKLKTKGEQWVIYVDAENQIPSTEVTFTSSNQAVVTVSKRGVLTAVGNGTAMITAEYKGQKVKCRVLCVFD